MNAPQLLQQLRVNHNLITQNNVHAYEHLLMLKNDYPHLINEEIELQVELNMALAEVHFNSNYQRAIETSLAVLQKSKESEHKHLVALHLKMVGHGYAQTGEFELAEKYLLQALDYVLPNDTDYASNRALILYTLAMNHELKEDGPEMPIKYLNEAIELLADESYTVKRANCIMGLGNVYNSIEDVEQALKYYLLAAKHFEDNYYLANMAASYSNIGNCYIKLENFDQAEKYLQKSLELRLKFGTPNEISISYYNLAILHKERGELERAEELLVQTQKRVQEVGGKPFLEMIDIEFADLAEKKENLLKAKTN